MSSYENDASCQLLYIYSKARTWIQRSAVQTGMTADSFLLVAARTWIQRSAVLTGLTADSPGVNTF